jgi:hypothetical protein
MPFGGVGVPAFALAQLVRPNISVSENDPSGEEMRFSLAADSVRVANSCDTALGPFLDDPSRALCFSLVAHADGDLVTGEGPVRPGEALVLYAFGLGACRPKSRQVSQPRKPWR